MTIINLYQVGQDAYNAGWRGISLAEAIAVSYGEARAIGWTVDTLAVNVNSNGSRDRGMWALNDLAHPSITDAMAFDQKQSSALAHAIFLDQGWGPWVAYGGESYQKVWDSGLPVLIARQLMALPGWSHFVPKGYMRVWSKPKDQWVYRQMANGVLVSEIDVPMPDPLTGFTVWDGVAWRYEAPPLT